MPIRSRDAMVSSCGTAALLAMITLGVMGVGCSRETITFGQILVPMPAMFLLFMCYFALPFYSSRNTKFQHAKTMFVLATTIGFLMPTVIAVGSPTSYPPRLLNTNGLAQSTRDSLHKGAGSLKSALSLRPTVTEALRIRHVLATLDFEIDEQA